jgi:hypothetical protein
VPFIEEDTVMYPHIETVKQIVRDFDIVELACR